MPNLLCSIFFAASEDVVKLLSEVRRTQNKGQEREVSITKLLTLKTTKKKIFFSVQKCNYRGRICCNRRSLISFLLLPPRQEPVSSTTTRTDGNHFGAAFLRQYRPALSFSRLERSAEHVKDGTANESTSDGNRRKQRRDSGTLPKAAERMHKPMAVRRQRAPRGAVLTLF